MYQFIHVESYSKVSAKKKLNYNNETKGRNVSDIIGEVTRKKGYCDHVEEPKAPTVLYGVHPEELEALTEDYFNNTKLTNSKGIKRGLRKDSHILLAGVVSLNRECEGFWEDYKKDSIQWLKEKYGDKLKCVVEHTDEANPHLHFYCVQNPGEDFNLLHEGKKAFQSEEKKYKKEIAFKEAMRAYQENFFSAVSAKYGLMKNGPKRSRLTNEEYKRRQQEIKLINLHKEKTITELEELINKTSSEIENQKKKAKSEIILIKDKTIANATERGKKEGFISSIKDFENKSYFNKFIFSRSFSLSTIEKLEKENKKVKENYNNLMSRKNNYKRESKDLKKLNSDLKHTLEKEKEKSNYYELINDFINENEEKKEEYGNDIRKAITREIDTIEKQQQRLNKTIEQIKPRVDFNERKADTVGERIRKSHRVLFRNLNSFIRDFFRVKLFERKLEEEKTTKINKYKPKQETEQKNNITGKDRKLKLK